ncbi:hypothetical protein HELRODRAFT_75787 [Helobdella robusta]|uniref:WD repeat-containing protein 27 n=1 Tax=Helobdella robusta TaxID=6412 RepID=T1G2A1_HELRO|nr:hypothetical protein HELRODRAFT_75787 [Helobdella robusta]ESO07617.1 hypothetical protein HELRODRAFT_75787 [Helobdella robusta]
MSFSQSLSHCQFYYVDKFIIIASGNEIVLYSYHIDNIKSDLKRQITNSKYKQIKTIKMSEFQNISAFSAVNSFYSYIGLCCGSNKSIAVIDFNVGSVITQKSNTHERCIHTIEQFTEPNNGSSSDHQYNLFLTSAASDCIKLWDLRTREFST